MGYPRSHLVATDAAGWYHCTSRCVRRAFLCGADALTGRDYEYRRQWIADRIIELADIFAVAVYGYAVMSNHYHVVVRVAPDIASRWSDEDVADRWIELFPRGDETRDQLHRDGLLADPERLALLRQRLGSLSWFMRCLNEPIARRANADDDVRGHFWEARFKCQALLDDHAVLAAMAYVDLNPVRAGIATDLAGSDYTSVQARLRAMDVDQAGWQAIADSVEASKHGPAALRPVAGPSGGEDPCLALPQYIALVDWTGRQWREGKASIDASRPPALAALGIGGDDWLKQVRGVGSGYWRAVGRAELLVGRARSLGQRWLRGVSYARRLGAALR
jgi:REP element-mobilizing transposase RayT